jgi:molybdopterin converting factor small subunit
MTNCNMPTTSLKQTDGAIGAMKELFASIFLSLFRPGSASEDEIEIMYFGRTSEFLMMTSERLDISGGVHTLAQMLDGLRMRGDNWAYELDEDRVICTINRKAARLSDTVAAGDEIAIFSRKSIFEG